MISLDDTFKSWQLKDIGSSSSLPVLGSRLCDVVLLNNMEFIMAQLWLYDNKTTYLAWINVLEISIEATIHCST